MYRAHYIKRKPCYDRDEYWRTIAADDICEATKIANRYARRGYVCARISKDITHD